MNINFNKPLVLGSLDDRFGKVRIKDIRKYCNNIENHKKGEKQKPHYNSSTALAINLQGLL
jgi:hypothetical protein